MFTKFPHSLSLTMAESAKVEPKSEEVAKKEENVEEKKEENNVNNKDKKEIEEGSWLALESNPGPLNKFAARMGLPDDFAFCDIYGLDPELLAFISSSISTSP